LHRNLAPPLDSSRSSAPSNKDNSGQLETIPPPQESEEGLRLGIRTGTEFVTAGFTKPHKGCAVWEQYAAPGREQGAGQIAT